MRNRLCELLMKLRRLLGFRVFFLYYTLIFTINKNKIIDDQLNKLELQALEYHIRAMSTPKGILELERQINKRGNPF